MKVIATERLPIKMWLEDIENDALEQARNLANLPFAFRHIAIMPDSHTGYGMPIGGVMAAKNAIIPNAVGVDIGCGMCAVKTSLRGLERERLQAIVNRIQECVPTGFHWHETPQGDQRMPDRQPRESMPVVWTEYEKALRQIGTLGGGNHFIEVQQGSDGHVWVMIHSGSRNIGKKVADHYNKMAVELNDRWHSQVPRSHQLAFLPLNTPEADLYKNEMGYCVAFALANRRLMMERIQDVFTCIVPGVTFEPLINIAHNYAAMEHHFGSNVMVHRKGATQAKEGQLGIIPGSQGSKSYIVRGKGNPQSFQSCSHGAGRKLGRKQAIRELDLEQQQAIMNAKGIIHAIHCAKDLDEAPGAYKDIDTVMANQADLVDIAVELTPLAVIKASEE